MYKNVKKLAMMLIAAATMLTVACSKDDNNSNNNPGNGGEQEEAFEMASLDITYKISVDERAITAMTEGYTPTLQYYDANDQSVNATPFPLTSDNRVWEISLTQSSFPSHFGFKLALTPKDGIAEDVKYDCDLIPTITAIATGKDGKKVNVSPSLEEFHWRGIKPSNGRVMKIEKLYKIKKDGNIEQGTFDYPD